MAIATSNEIRERFMRIWWTLKLTYGLLFVVAGADKFMNLVTQWGKYVSPHLLNTIPLDPAQFIHLVGIVEICIGLLTLSMLTRIGAYLIAAWFFIIVLNLLSMLTYFDIAVRDTVLAIGAIALAQLTEIKDEAYS